ncbi:MAG: hypothetical protein K6A68_09740 [Clostridiales bacterium]|nr:hypothetical protein [Clostridiales bacterium]
MQTKTNESRKLKAGKANKPPGKKYGRPAHVTTLCGACAAAKSGGCCPVSCPLFRRSSPAGAQLVLK